MPIRPGPRNLITDVHGIAVGNAHSADVQSGVTVVRPDSRAIAACDVRGGAPGTRETDALDPANLVDAVDAVVLSGGSVYGLDAMSGAVAWLGARDRGFRMAGVPRVAPIVPGAILFDLAGGGDMEWGEAPPYGGWGREACAGASRDFDLGNVGAGMGAMAGDIKGGLGSASAVDGALEIGALIAVNAFGSALVPGTGHFWAAPYELDGEFGGKGWPSAAPAVSAADPLAGTRAELRPLVSGRTNTTIGVVATNAALSNAEARRIAIMAQDGLARAIRPVHSHVDGDALFVLATGALPLPAGPADRLAHLMRIGAIAADCVARAAARGVYAAHDLGDAVCYRSRHEAKAS
ncbi:MAG: P1 family peptidase [Hyphomicrobium sp.]|uniref:P1 family peptidase n=1 Tax=Hyphomicrobium sp. TaxID=82 RepID=UPI003D1365B5